MTTRVTFKSSTGSEVSGELAEPSGTGKAPSIVLVQEYWGVNGHIKDIADRLAKDGFLVVAPDLYHGKITTDATEAAKLMTELDTLQAVKEIGGAAGYLKEHARGNGKVAVMGFCLGGALSLASACHVPGLSAVVAYYGLPPAEKVDFSKVTAPIMMHVAKKDQWVSPEKAEALKAQLDKLGKKMELHVYDADHAFNNDTRPTVFAPEAAKQAWDRSVAFMKQNLT